MRLVLILTFLPCVLASSASSPDADEAHAMARALAADDAYSFSYDYVLFVSPTAVPVPAPTVSPPSLAPSAAPSAPPSAAQPVEAKKKNKEKDSINTAIEHPVFIVLLAVCCMLLAAAICVYKPKADTSADDGKVVNPVYNVQDDIVREDHPSMIEVLPEDRAYALGEIMEG